MIFLQFHGYGLLSQVLTVDQLNRNNVKTLKLQYNFYISMICITVWYSLTKLSYAVKERPSRLSLSAVTVFRIKWKGNDICMPECVNLSRELSQVDLYLNCTDLISSRHGDFLHKMSSKWINMSLKCRLSKCPSIPIMLCSVCVRIGSQDYVLVLLWFIDSQSFVF